MRLIFGYRNRELIDVILNAMLFVLIGMEVLLVVFSATRWWLRAWP